MEGLNVLEEELEASPVMEEDMATSSRKKAASWRAEKEGEQEEREVYYKGKYIKTL